MPLKILSAARNICAFLFLAVFALTCAAASAADAPGGDNQNKAAVRVAVMPTISRWSGYGSIVRFLDSSLEKQMQLSLNSTLQRAEYIDRAKVLYAMEDSGFTSNPCADTLKQTADLLNADVIVGYSVPIMYERYFYAYARRGDGPLMQSYISLKLWAYYKPLDKIITLSDKEYYFDVISTSGRLRELASDASYNLNKKADLKNLLKQSVQAAQAEQSVQTQ